MPVHSGHFRLGLTALAGLVMSLSAGCTAGPAIVAVPVSSNSPSPSSAAAPVGSTGTAPSGSALAVLASLPTKGRAPQTGYVRSQFGDAWTDDVAVDGGHNGCDTRNDVLRRDLTAVVVRAGTHGCVAASGTLHDPYTGTSIAFLRGSSTSDRVQIDHVVALSDAWQTGAQALTAERRQELANDPLELLAVDRPSNQRKQDSDAASWLPPNRTYRCQYVARQIAVKARYGLWVTASERAAMTDVLSGCRGQAAQEPSQTDVPRLQD